LAGRQARRAEDPARRRARRPAARKGRQMMPLRRTLLCVLAGGWQCGCIYWPWPSSSSPPGAAAPGSASPAAERPPRRAHRPPPPAAPPTPEQLRQAEARRRQAELLVARLAGADDAEARRIEDQLAALGEQAIIPLKMAEMSGDFELRRRAGRIGRSLRWRMACRSLDDVLPGAAEAMAGDERQARADVVDRAVKVAGMGDLPFLRECLADGDDYVRQRAIDGLVNAVDAAAYDWRDSARAAVAPILSAAAGEDDRSMRLLALGAMAKVRAVDVERAASLLHGADMETCMTAVEALGAAGTLAARGHLAPMLGDGRWRIRAAALEALKHCPPPPAGGGLAGRAVEMLGDEDDFVRSRAARLLTRWADEEDGRAVPLLVAAAKPHVRCSREVLDWLCDLLAAERRVVVQLAAHRALMDATGQKLPFEPGPFALVRALQVEAWRKWVRQNARPMAEAAASGS